MNFISAPAFSCSKRKVTAIFGWVGVFSRSLTQFLKTCVPHFFRKVPQEKNNGMKIFIESSGKLTETHYPPKENFLSNFYVNMFFRRFCAEKECRQSCSQHLTTPIKIFVLKKKIRIHGHTAVR